MYISIVTDNKLINNIKSYLPKYNNYHFVNMKNIKILK